LILLTFIHIYKTSKAQKPLTFKSSTVNLPIYEIDTSTALQTGKSNTPGAFSTVVQSLQSLYPTSFQKFGRLEVTSSQVIYYYVLNYLCLNFAINKKKFFFSNSQKKVHLGCSLHAVPSKKLFGFTNHQIRFPTWNINILSDKVEFTVQSLETGNHNGKPHKKRHFSFPCVYCCIMPQLKIRGKMEFNEKIKETIFSKTRKRSLRSSTIEYQSTLNRTIKSTKLDRSGINDEIGIRNDVFRNRCNFRCWR
jgi:hypothetical protein